MEYKIVKTTWVGSERVETDTPNPTLGDFKKAMKKLKEVQKKDPSNLYSISKVTK